MSAEGAEEERRKRERRQAELAEIMASMAKPVTWTAPGAVASKVEARGSENAAAAAAAAAAAVSSDDSSSPSDSDSSSNSSVDATFPTSEMFCVAAHQKMITSIGIDKAGIRMATGALDGMVYLWDFAAGAGLDPPKPFRTLSGSDADAARSGSQCAVATLFNTGSKLLCVARADPQVNVYDRDGTDGKGGSAEPKIRTTRGDQYIHDMTKTKGHIAAVTGACWSTVKETTLVTSSSDGTVRIWDVENGPRALLGLELANTMVLKSKTDRPGRNSVLALSLTSAQRVVAACADGTLQFWGLKDAGAYSVRPDTTTASFPCVEGAVPFLDVSSDGMKVAMSFGSCVRLWDVRKLQSPVWTLPDLAGAKGLSFSPDDASLAVASHAGLACLESRTGRVLVRPKQLPGPASSNVVWHEALNQLAVGCANGAAALLFDPSVSERGGAMLALETKERSAQRRLASQPRRQAEMFANVDEEALTRADYDSAVPIDQVDRIRASVPGKSKRAQAKERAKKLKSTVHAGEPTTQF